MSQLTARGYLTKDVVSDDLKVTKTLYCSTIQATDSTASLSFKVGESYATAVAIDKDGNVGVGVAVPTAKLHVDGSVLKVESLPTADPMVVGQVWSNNGVLTLSVAV